MVKKKLILVCSLVVLLIGGGVMFNLNGDNFSINNMFKSPRDKQLSWLEEHETEIISWVKSKYPKIESVQLDWDTLEVGPVSNGIFTTHYNLSVEGIFNDNSDTIIQVDFLLNDMKDIPDIKNIRMNIPPMIKVDRGLYMYE